MCIILLLFVFSAGVQPPNVPQEPDLKQLSDWVTDLDNKDFAKQNAAVSGLAKAGHKALPVLPDLIKLIERKEGQLSWGTIHAINVVGAIGPEAKEAIPALLTHVKPGFGRGYMDNVAIALAKIDKPHPEATKALLLSSSKGSPLLLRDSEYLKSYRAAVAAHLLVCCDDKDLDTRERALVVLGGLPIAGFYDNGQKPLALEAKELSKDVLQKFEKMLDDSEPLVRLIAAHAISRTMSEKAAKVIPTVVAVMSDPKSQEKVRQYRTVPILSPIPKEAASALIELFDGENPGRSWAIDVLTELPVVPQMEALLREGKTARRREAAAISLGNRRARSGSSNVVLKTALADQEFVVRFASAVALVKLGGRLGETSADGVAVLIEGLKQEDEGIRFQAAERLATVGPRAKSAVPDLKRLLSDPKPAVSLESALALVEIVEAEVVEAIPVLIIGLQSDKEPTIIRSARALGAFGPAAKAAVPELIKRFTLPTPLPRIAAAEAVARIDPEQMENAVAVLVSIVKKYHNASSFHLSALNALATIGPGAKSALPALLATLPADKKVGRYFPVELALAVMAIDPETAKPVLAFIHETVLKGDEDDGIDLARQVRKLGARSKPLIAELILMLGSKNLYIRECSAVALGEIGPDANEALPKLKELAAGDDNPQIRKYAAEAAKKIERK
jgi:HEAT repeat protein